MKQPGMFLRIAYKSALMHRKRSIVVILAATLTVTILTIISGMISGVVNGFYNGSIEESGHIRIRSAQAAQALDPRSLKLLFPNNQELWKTAAKAPGASNPILVQEAILDFAGLLIEADEGEKNLGIVFHGTIPESHYFQRAASHIVEGRFLGAPREIALSRRAAALLGKNLNDTVMVLVKDYDGNPWYEQFTIGGIFHTQGQTFDETNAFMLLSDAQGLLGADGLISELRLSFTDRDAVARDTALIQAAVTGETELVVENWLEIHANTFSLLTMVRVGSIFMEIWFIIVATSIITNTVLMSVFERVREYGTLRAIGLKRSQERSLILTESSILGLAGSIIGLMVGLGAILAISSVGVDLGGMMEAIGLDRLSRPVITVENVIICLGTGWAVAFLSSLYAARVISKLSVVDSLNHI